MFQHLGIWLPDGEKHFPEWMSKHGEIVDGRGTYQIRKLRAALGYCRQFRVAIDVGAHVGLWSMHLARKFQYLRAFEPVAAFRECFAANVQEKNAMLYGFALGAATGKVRMKIPALAGGIDSGGTHVDPVCETGEIMMRRLDDLNLGEVDFLKIDCEGFEHQVIEGARETLRAWKPVVIVEQKPHKLVENFGLKGTPAVDRLKALGAMVRREMGGDYIMSW